MFLKFTDTGREAMKQISMVAKLSSQLLVITLLCGTVYAQDKTITVHPSGGVAGIHAALKSARDIRMKSPGVGAIRIALQPGEYSAANGPLTITHEDSGTVDAPTIIQSQVPGGAVIVGATAIRPVSGSSTAKWTFQPAPAPGKSAELTAGQFFVNGQRAVLARHPNKDQYFFVDKPVLAENNREASKATFTLNAADAQALRTVVEGEEDRAVLTVMQSWSSGHHRLASINAANQVTVKPAARWPFLHFGHSQRVFVNNTSKALDAPGEWVANSGVIEYIRRPADSYQDSEARWPRVSGLVKIAGNPGAGLFVRHVQILDIGLAYTVELTHQNGWVGLQAASDIGAAVMVDGARNLKIGNCSIAHTGGYGVWLRSAVQDSEISNCTMTDLGAGGIKIGEAHINSGIYKTGNNIVQGNRISWTGQDFPDAIGVWVGHSSGNKIRNNLIHNTSYSGISVGWQWGYATPSATDNDISNNALIDIGNGQLSDLGAIYTLGRSPGTVISGNFIRNVSAYPGYGPGGWGIYNDEGTSDVKVFNNVVLSTDSGGYHLHYGEKITVENNFFAKGKKAELRWTAPSRSGALTLMNNGIVNSLDRWFDINGANHTLISAGNVINKETQGGLRVASGPTAAEVMITGGTKEQSDAWSSTIANAYALLGSQSISSPIQRLLKAKNDTWAVDLDLIPLGGRPIDVKHFPASPALAISVVADGSGGKALNLQDGFAGMVKWDPHFYFPVNVDSGVSVSRFTVRPDANTELFHEWRDSNHAYNTGPRVLIRQSQLWAGNSMVSSLPTNAWIEVEVRQDLSNKTGNWTLRWRTVSPTVSNWTNLGPYAPASKGVPDRWRWVGWYSNGVTTSSTLMKNITFERTGP